LATTDFDLRIFIWRFVTFDTVEQQITEASVLHQWRMWTWDDGGVFENRVLSGYVQY
jgi:hypothetical protein